MEAIENAYVVLIGQIVLIASAVAFGVPYFLSQTATGSVVIAPTTEFYLIFVLAVSVMSVVNLVIGWAAVRASMGSKNNSYPNKMFIVDILIVITFFLMNNVIMFSFGDTLALQNASTIKHVMDIAVPIHTVSFMAAELYALTAVFLVLCKIWNHFYYASAGTKRVSMYEFLLWVIIMICGVFCIGAIIYKDVMSAQIVMFVIWILAWIYINTHWLVGDFFNQTKIP